MKNSSESKFFTYRVINTLIMFIALVIVFSLFTPRNIFISVRNLASLGKLVPDLGVVALGIGILMVCGEFDLSISSTLPLCSYIFASALFGGLSPVWGFVLALLSGLALGFINGLIVVKTRMPSFIITLGTMMFWKGILYVWSRMMPTSIRTFIPTDSLFQKVLTGSIGPFFPVQTIWFVAFAIVLGIILHFHRFGNWIYATGDNQEAARAMGINTNLVKIICFMIVGVLCAFAGCMQSVRLGSFAATQGVGSELRAMAACVIGGTSLRGGIGSMMGVFLGILTLHILDNGLVLMRVPVFGVNAFIGLATIFFVLLNSYLDRKIK